MKTQTQSNQGSVYTISFYADSTVEGEPPWGYYIKNSRRAVTLGTYFSWERGSYLGNDPQTAQILLNENNIEWDGESREIYNPDF